MGGWAAQCGTMLHRQLMLPPSQADNLCKAFSVVPGIKLPLNKRKLLLVIITRSCRINMEHLSGVPILLNGKGGKDVLFITNTGIS